MRWVMCWGRQATIVNRGEDMYIDIDRFEGEAKEPEIAFICEALGCRNIVRVGQTCYDNRLCEECGEQIEGAEPTYAEKREPEAIAASGR